MSVNFLKSSLALALALLSMGNGSDAKANDFYPQAQGQPMGLQMPGNIQLGAPMQMPGPQMPMSAPPMQQNYQPAPQSAGYGPGPAMQNHPGYGPQTYPGMSPMSQPMPAPYSPQPQLPPEKIQIADENCPVDLVITDISFYVPATKLAGPSYTVKVRNKGTHYAQRFHIGLFASLDGVVNEQTPKAFLEVRDLAPGSDGDYTISLPLNSDSNFDPRFGQFRPFTHLAAVVDVFRIQPEGDESNNTAMLPRQVVDNAQE